jgi:methionyl-tRNA formyltransferase
MKIKKQVVVLGKGKLAIKVAQWFYNHKEYELLLIVPVIPEPNWTTSISEWATKNNIPLIKSGHYKDIPVDIQIDLAISVTYDKIIKKSFIDRCNRIINIHNSPLPKYRGVSPINWALKNNEKDHGVTIHEITPGIDDGPIWGQVKFPIYPKVDEVKDVYRRCLDFGWTLFKTVIPLIDQITPTLQTDSQATYYDLSKNDLLGERRFFTKKQSLK